MKSFAPRLAPVAWLAALLVAPLALGAPPARAEAGVITARNASGGEVLLQQSLAIALGGQEVGTVDFLDRKTADGVELSRTAKLTVKRGATVTEMKTVTVVKLRADLSPVSYHYERTDAAGTLVADGALKDGKLLLTTTQNGATVKTEKPVPPGTTFMVALEHELRQSPRDGQHIERSVVIEELGAVVAMTTDVKKKSEGVFEVTSTFMNLTTVEEMDTKGRTLVQRTPAMNIVAYPVGRAPADIGKGTADLMAVSTWKVQPVRSPAQRVVYKISAPDMGDFNVPEDARQKILERTPTSVTVEVKAGDTFNGALGPTRKQELLEATPYEAIGDPRIQKAARAATQGATGRLDEIARLVQFVHEHVETKGLDRGYAPAVTTLESKSGDCTEHSVLLSALLRARGFPTRLVDGVVVGGTSAGYHEWVEVYVEGRGFVPADPTFGAFPAGPERLKLAVGSTSPDDHLQLSLAASRLLKSGVKLEVLSAE